MYFFSYLKFLFSATNQHGVHSPFVYALVTKGLYSSKKYTTKKSLSTLLNVITYFKIDAVNITKEDKEVGESILKTFPKIEVNKTTQEFFYFNSVNEARLSRFINDNQFQNTSIVFVDAIYKDQKSWNNLIKSDKITVSINFFYGGLLFFRKEQVKEDFKIRI